MKKILFFCYSMEGGGAEKICKILANDFALNMEYQVSLFLIKNKGVYLKQLNKSIKIIHPNKYLRFFNILNFVKLLRVVFNLKPNYLVSFAEWPNFYSGFLKYFFKNIKIILSERSSKTFINDYKVYNVSYLVHWLSKISYRKADKIICCSKSVRNGVAEVVKNDYLTTIYNPIDVEESLKKSKELTSKFIDLTLRNFIALGRLHPSKDYFTMLKAFDYAYKKNNLINLYILGEGKLKKDLLDFKETLESKNKIHFLGYIENPFPILAKCDALVHSAVYEGFGNIFIEALSVGTPIVTTNCNTPKEIMTEELHGSIVPVGDHVLLGEAILKQPKKNEEIIKSCIERSKFFDINNFLKSFKREIFE